MTAVSAVISAFAVMRLLFAPATGRLVTVLGERRIYLTGLLIVAASTLACAFAGSYWQLLMFRAAGGIGSTMFTVSAMALLIRLAPPALRGRASGYFSAGFLIGNLTGPLIGAGLVGFGLQMPFIVYSIALVIAAVGVATMLPPVPAHPADTPGDAGPVETVTFGRALRDNAYRAILASNFAQGWATMGVRIALVPLFVTDTLGRSDTWAGVILAFYAAGNMLAILTAGRLSDRFGRRPVLLPGLAVGAAATIALGYSPNLTVALLLTTVAGLGSGLFAPTHQAALGDVLGTRQRGGSALAAYGMASDLGAVVGPLAAGAIATVWGFGPAFAVTGLTMVVALVMWLVARETLPSAPPVTTPVAPTRSG